MLKQVTTKNFEGFANGTKPGEHYFSQGLTKSRYGIAPGWSHSSGVSSATASLASLNLSEWLTQQKISGVNYIFAYSNTNKAIFSKTFSTDFVLAYKNGQNGANGIIGDQKARVLYVQDQYLGKHDSTADYVTGTVSVTNGSAAVVGTGTTFIAGDVDKMFSVDGLAFYRISGYTDATHITLSGTYSGATNATAAYTIYRGWDDKWKDFGSAVTNTLQPTEMYEDVVLIGRNNNICRLNSDDSINDDSNPAINFPTNFVNRAIKSGKNGVLLGFNINNRGVIALWDNYSTRSIAPWIWYDANIQSIAFDGDNWIVVTTNNIYKTNGYSSAELVEGVDTTQIGASLSCYPQGTAVIRSWLLILNNSGGFKRNKAGIYALNMKTGLYNFIPVENKYLYGQALGAVLYDSASSIHISHSVAPPTGATSYNLSVLSAGIGAPGGYLITELLGASENEKYAKAVKLDMGIYDKNTEQKPFVGSFSVKIAPDNRQLWAYQFSNATASGVTKVRVDGSVAAYANAQVGDEVTVLHGANAGEVRHITAIANSGLNTEEWTVDVGFSNVMENGAALNVSPFQLTKTYTISSGFTLNDMWFDLQKNVKGKRFYVKLLMSGLTATIPDLNSLTFIYDELGALQ